MSTVRAAALVMVRNEQNILPTCIGHLLHTLGMERVYVTDDGSTDATPAILRRLATETGRVVVDTNSGEYRQVATMTAMAHRAMADGAEWLFPTDADEFLWLRPGATLAALCARTDIGGYRIPLRNFVQARFVRHDGPRALLTMGVSALPVGTVEEGWPGVVTGRIPFVCINYPAKVVLRAAPGLELEAGSHSALRTAGPLEDTDAMELLHAPIRSLDDMHARVEQARRVAAVSRDPGSNWHMKRVVAMTEAELADEWRRNSFELRRPARRGEMRIDLRLSRIGLRQRRFDRWARLV